MELTDADLARIDLQPGLAHAGEIRALVAEVRRLRAENEILHLDLHRAEGDLADARSE